MDSKVVSLIPEACIVGFQDANTSLNQGESKSQVGLGGVVRGLRMVLRKRSLNGCVVRGSGSKRASRSVGAGLTTAVVGVNELGLMDTDLDGIDIADGVRNLSLGFGDEIQGCAETCR